MPIYEYQCEKCGERLEVMQRMSEDPLKKHLKKHCKDKKACGGKLKKLISQTSFSPKGGGWAADGYTGRTGD